MVIETGEVHSAKLNFTDSSSNLVESDSGKFDLELTRAIKADIELFTDKIKSISAQEKIFQSFSSFPIKKLFTEISSNLSQIYQSERYLLLLLAFYF